MLVGELSLFGVQLERVELEGESWSSVGERERVQLERAAGQERVELEGESWSSVGERESAVGKSVTGESGARRRELELSWRERECS